MEIGSSSLRSTTRDWADKTNIIWNIIFFMLYQRFKTNSSSEFPSLLLVTVWSKCFMFLFPSSKHLSVNEEVCLHYVDRIQLPVPRGSVPPVCQFHTYKSAVTPSPSGKSRNSPEGRTWGLWWCVVCCSWQGFWPGRRLKRRQRRENVPILARSPARNCLLHTLSRIKVRCPTYEII